MSKDGTEAALGEQAAKHERVRALLERTGADGLLLRRASSFAWATGGVSSVINMAADAGEGALLYTPDERLLLTNSIEAPRYELETPVSERGWRVESSAWYTHPPDPAQFCSGRIVCDGPWLGADADVSGDVALLRAALLPAEQQRMHALGRDCAEIVETAMRHVRRGGTEFDLAADIARGSFARGIEPIVVLVAADERARRFRHPRPTNTAIETYAMSVLCGRRYGMVCSVSRLAHIGPVPADLARRHRAAAAVDARLLKGSVPGATLGSLFDDAIACYAEHG
ncbi:MAG: antitoxin VapB, partial [Thermoleophilia bacterium]|nr:antitoxin VapB [Thermoleophilia bacterium]